MATASLGALSVDLGADTRGLRRGEAQAEAAFKRLESRMNRVSAIAKRVGVALAAAFSVGALARISRQAIDTADQMAKMSQQVGVSVESLSALSHAAELSGASFESLTGSMQRLSRTVQQSLTNPTSEAARTFDALDVSIRDAQGNVKSTEQLLLDVSDRMSQFADGTNKTALAMNLFGREGAKLIPLMNSGADGIREMQQEAHRLGIVIDTRTAKAAERFNDNMTRLQRVFDGVVRTTLAKVLPSFEGLTNRIVEMIQDSDTLQRVTDRLAIAMKGLATAAIAAAGGIGTLIEFGRSFANMFTMEFGKATKSVGEELEELFANFKDVLGPVQSTLEMINKLWEEQGATLRDDTVPAYELAAKAQAPVIQSTTELASRQREYNELLAEGQRIISDLQSPYERLAAVQERLNQIFRAGAIDAKTLGLAMQQANMAAASSYAGLASNVSNSLSQMFHKNKAFAVANAIANTAESITKTLAQYGGTPWGWANAAAAAAAGAAQIAQIRRTTPGGGGSTPRVGGGSSQSASASSSGGQGTVLRIQTVGAGDLISGDVFRDLMERIQQWQRDGGSIALEPI